MTPFIQLLKINIYEMPLVNQIPHIYRHAYIRKDRQPARQTRIYTSGVSTLSPYIDIAVISTQVLRTYMQSNMVSLLLQCVHA